jgi:hypothetical protein
LRLDDAEQNSLRARSFRFGTARVNRAGEDESQPGSISRRFVETASGACVSNVGTALAAWVMWKSLFSAAEHLKRVLIRRRDWKVEELKFMAKLVTGVFKTRVAAEAAVDAILKRGYTREEISVLMSDATKSKEFAIETGTRAADGLGYGAAVGGAVGAVLAAIAAVGTNIILPGIGLVVAGPLAAALAGAGAGGAAGGLIGALVGAGIPEHRAKVYDASLRAGGILIGVEAKTDEEADKLEELLGDLGAEYVRQE